MIPDDQNDDTKRITEYLYNKLSGTCRRHMDIMAHKHELQRLLFNMGDNLSRNTTTSEITMLINYLQSLAFAIQKITVC